MKMDALARFSRKIQVNDNGCWEWQGTKDSQRYGRLKVNGKPIFAHRFSYSIFKGPLQPGLCIMHTCDNPPCCNPEHLRQGTHGDNMRDKVNKGRCYWKKQTHCVNGHEFTVENTYIRPSRPTERYCVRCKRESVRLAKMRRRSRKK